MRGELKVELYDPSSRALRKGALVWLGERGPFRVLAARVHAPAILVSLEGIDDRDGAQRLVGADVSVERDTLPPLDPDEFYLADLVGFEVRTAAGDLLGTMEGEAKGLAQTTLIVRRDGQDLLVPAVPGILVAVDPAARRIIVDPPEGLLE